MKNVITLLLLLALGISTVIAQQPHPLTGSWLGKMEIKPDLVLTVAFEVKPDGSTVMHSLDQGAYDIAVDELKLQDGQVLMVINTINGTYRGQLVTPDSISGGMNQGGGDALWPLQLAKVAYLPNPKPKRPQEPTGEVPYKAEQVTYQNEAAGVTLAGTLTIPNSSGPHPALLLIPGSGPSDRDQTIFGHKVFLVWADMLTRAGYVVLRADDRGVAASTGDYKSATIPDLASDAVAAVNFLKTRKEVDARHVGLIGHSLGAEIAPLAANRADVAYVVLMAGAGIPLKEALLYQTEAIYSEAGASPEGIALNNSILKAAFKIIESETDNEVAKSRLEKELTKFNPGLAKLSPEEIKILELSYPINPKDLYGFLTPAGRSELLYDPQAALKKMKVPVLAAFGSKDQQVLPVNIPYMEKALRKSGSKSVTVKVFDGKNHLFQPTATGSIPEYGKIENTIDPAVMEYVVSWLNEQRRLHDVASINQR